MANTVLRMDREERQAFAAKANATTEQSDPKAKYGILGAALAPALSKPDITPSVAQSAQQLEPAPSPESQPETALSAEVLDAHDAMTVTVRNKKVAGRPMHGDRPKIDKTFTIDADLNDRLVRISNLDGLRLNRKIPVSVVMSHLIYFALAHVKDDRVMPGPDGTGLIYDTEGSE